MQWMGGFGFILFSCLGKSEEMYSSGVSDWLAVQALLLRNHTQTMPRVSYMHISEIFNYAIKKLLSKAKVKYHM